jgi:N-acetylglucosaminyldiphosphoundecaprenol N-acetyl-beta-D-mannosaminyltransferase
MTRRYNILGTQIDALTLVEGLSQSAARMESGPAVYICLPYVEFIIKAQQNPQVQKVLNHALLNLPNGVSLNWAAQYLYGGRRSFGRFLSSLIAIVARPTSIHQLLPARFDSSNFTWPLLERAASGGKKVFLIGSPKKNTIEVTARHLTNSIPGLNIVGTFPGYISKAGEIQLIERLRQLQPDLILVGMGFPQQELLMERLTSQLDHGLLIGEGGSFDYQQFGGTISRSPQWLRRLGLEWLWRLIRQPQRLGRQMAIPKYIWLVYRSGQQQL